MGFKLNPVQQSIVDGFYKSNRQHALIILGIRSGKTVISYEFAMKEVASGRNVRFMCSTYYYARRHINEMCSIYIDLIPNVKEHKIKYGDNVIEFVSKHNKDDINSTYLENCTYITDELNSTYFYTPFEDLNNYRTIILGSTYSPHDTITLLCQQIDKDDWYFVVKSTIEVRPEISDLITDFIEDKKKYVESEYNPKVMLD